MRTIAIILILSSAAQAQCFNRSSYGDAYVAPYVAPSYSYPYTDNRLQVTYNIAFPPPAVSGATQFAYTPPNYGFNFDAMEALKLELNQRGRFAELAGDSKTASLIIQQSGAGQQQAYNLAIADKLKGLFETTGTPGTTYEFKAQRDAAGKLQLSGPGGDGPPLAAPGEPLGAAAIFKAKCTSCHNPTKHDGELDLTDLSKITPDIGLKLLDRITTNDPARRMPKGGTLTSKQIFSLHSDFIQTTGAKQ